jgi:hypothetical protein
MDPKSEVTAMPTPLASLRLAVSPLLVIGATMAALGGCRSGDHAEEPVASTEAVTGADTVDFVELAGGEEQALYLQMLKVELDAGIKVPPERLHTVRGLAACKAPAAGSEGEARCDVYVRTSEDELAAPQPLAASAAKRIVAFAQASRSDLPAANQVALDVVCDYVGKKSPPYDIEAVKCRAMHARAPVEAVFDGQVAEELAEDVRGKTTFGTGIATVGGALTCRSTPGSGRSVCFVRAGTGGTLSDEVKELKAAGEIARGLRRSVTDAARLATPIGAKAPAPPSANETAAVLTCRVDSARLTDEGLRAYFCRATP